MIKLTCEEKLKNLTKGYEDLLMFLMDKHPAVYDEYKKHLVWTGKPIFGKREVSS